MIALRPATSRKKPRVPAGVRIYAIGDIHGRVDLLDEVLKRIDADLEQNPISVAIEVYLGDYIDRGPASQQVIDRLVTRNRTFRAIFLKGNHEAYLTGFTTNPVVLDEWQQFGGLETLRSYGIAPPINIGADARATLTDAFRQALPVSHRRFFDNLRLSFTCRRLLFRPCGGTARDSANKATRRRSAVDSSRFSPLRRGIQQDHRSRAHPHAGAGYSSQPYQYRHWGLRNGTAHLPETGRRSYRFHLRYSEETALEYRSAASP